MREVKRGSDRREEAGKKREAIRNLMYTGNIPILEKHQTLVGKTLTWKSGCNNCSKYGKMPVP